MKKIGIKKHLSQLNIDEKNVKLIIEGDFQPLDGGRFTADYTN